MTLERTAVICVCIVITSAVATAQQGSGTADQSQQVPARSVTERTYAAGNFAPWRRVQTRSESASREVVVDSFEARDLEGRQAPVQEIVKETIQTGPGTALTTRDVFGFAPDHRRRLLETTESVQETRPGGDTSGVHTTWAQDLNGRPAITSRQIEQTRSAGSGVRQTTTTFLQPSPDEKLRETSRTEDSERRVNPGVVQFDSTQLVRDVNGRWQPIETRHSETREIGASAHQEETIQRRDMNGNLAVEEINITRRSTANAREDVVIETYAPHADGWSRPDDRLSLNQRVHRTTTATADGGHYTVEEVEERSRVAPTDPMRVIRRIETTVRRIGPDQWKTERQVFERDVNDRLRLVSSDTEERDGG